MKFSNPQEAWYHGLKQRSQCEGCLLSMLSVTFLILAVLLMISFSGCTSPTKVVTVPEVHEHHHWHSDTIRQTDSVVNNQTTVIREVDSATMARYGIQLKDMQRAWLVETNRLQRELSELRQSHADTIHVRDSIPYPVEVEKEVPAQLSWWQRLRLWLGNAVLLALAGSAAYVLLLRRRR